MINNKYLGQKLLQPYQFFKMITRKQMPEMFEDFLQADVIPLQMPELEDSVELLFIHSHDDLIEKALGEGESIIVIKDAIIGFTDKV